MSWGPSASLSGCSLSERLALGSGGTAPFTGGALTLLPSLPRVQPQQALRASGGEPWAESRSLTACQAAELGHRHAEGSWREPRQLHKPACPHRPGHVLDGPYRCGSRASMPGAFGRPCCPSGDGVSWARPSRPASGRNEGTESSLVPRAQPPSPLTL